MQNIRAAAVQFQHRSGDKAGNLEIVQHFVDDAAKQQADIVTFPEMCLTGYWHVRKLSVQELEELAEPVPDGPSTQALLRMSHQSGMTIGAGLIEWGDDGRLFNSYAVAMPNGRVECHRKLHVFVHPHLSPGDRFTVFDDPHGVRLGVLICYDNNLVENARINALAGAEVLLAPHQTGGCRTRSPRAMGPIDPALWEKRHHDPDTVEEVFRGPKGRGWLMRWLPARAHDNGMFLLFTNGVGVDDDEVRTGGAMIIDPYGEILAETTRPANDMVIADLDASVLPTSSGRRWLMARRPELYHPLTVPTGIERETRDVRFGE